MEADESEPFGIDFVKFEYCYAADGFSPGFSANQITENYTWQRIGLRWVSPSTSTQLETIFSNECISHHDLTILIMNTIGHNPEQMISQLLTRPSTEDMLNLMKVYQIESNLKLKKCRSDNSVIFSRRTLDGIRHGLIIEHFVLLNILNSNLSKRLSRLRR